jgi:rare lipoprotein A
MSRRIPGILLWLTLAVCFAGCGGKKQAKVNVPPPPPPIPQSPVPNAPPVSTETPDEDAVAEASGIPADSKPLFTETGLASWYGPPYHNRRGSNGEVYNMHAMTAAHRTLPLGSIVRVTNVKTGKSAVVRITDRGPFIEGRVIDLSLAAAKAIDLWKAGVAPVRLDVLKTPTPLSAGGRWAVQIGSFEHEEAANEIADRLTRRYRTAKVLRFASPIGDWWVRVRVQNDDRLRAESLAKETKTSEGTVFLVRLD